MSVDFREHWKQYIHLVYNIKPELTPSEASVCDLFFAKTASLGIDEVQMSQREIAAYTNLTERTVKTVIENLIALQILTVISNSGKRSSKRYRFTLPYSINRPLNKKHTKDYLIPKKINPDDLLRAIEGINEEYINIIDMLNEEGRKQLDSIIKNLPEAKKMEYRRVAAELLKPGESLDKKFREVVLTNEFGPVRIKEYTKPATKFVI